ncbi:MAG TPA: serine/threonine-protein kinase [Candidatus Eisenbacteria bacterium]|nr:serine/threonine-protein kinase [Candidatus Eisenbacteria bacterium]
MTRLHDRGIERLRQAIEAPDLEGSRYRIQEPLGKGGMGTVYLAEDLLLERPVAIKVLNIEGLSEEGVERMFREARTLARLEHPGIVPIHDLGRLPDGRVFYAMKRVRGERLDRHVSPATPLAERARLFLKLCEAVAFAHAAGILHRDIKPENVMVGEFGEVLILDWGVAKWASEARSSHRGTPAPTLPGPPAVRDTVAGTVLGTPAYMAPEQARGEAGRIDERTDVYGLGATLWFLLTGQPPGSGTAPRSSAMAAVCERAMAEDPEQRYPRVSELAEEVRRFLDDARVLAHREGPFELTARFVRRYRVAIGLVLAYVAVRALLLIRG